MAEMTDAALRQQIAQSTRKALGKLVEDEALAAPIVMRIVEEEILTEDPVVSR